jgi:large subunit ribosomal protein L21
MKYAVIQLAGKQYRVAEGDELTVNALELKDGEELVVKDVVLNVNDDQVEVGTPLLSTTKVTLQAVSTALAKKIRVAKYRAKSRYRKVFGHRQLETAVRVVSIK